MSKQIKWPEKMKVAYKAYKPIFKTKRKDLLKNAKEFQAWDFGYMDNVVFQMVRMHYDYFKNSDLLYQDTTHPMNRYDLLMKSLEECVTLIDQLEATFDYNKEDELRRKIYTIIATDGWRWSD